MLIRASLLFMILSIPFKPAFGQFETIINARKAKLTTPKLSISPDNYEMKITQFKKMITAKSGGELGLFKLKGNNLTVGATLGGFLEISDFIDDKITVFGLWRGNYRFMSFWEYQPLNKWLGKGNNITLSMGWAHESQHINTKDQFEYEFSYANSLFINDLITDRYFNYLIYSIAYSDSFSSISSFHVKGAYKYYYTGTEVYGTYDRLMEQGLTLEAGVNRKFGERLTVYLQGYYELIQHNFVANQYDYRQAFNYLNNKPLLYRKAELGLYFNQATSPLVNIHGYYTYSNGKHLNFPEIYEGYGLGLRVVL